MIISPNRKFVFVHLHKCAGTSIEMALAGALGVNDIVIGSTPDGERLQGFFGDVLGLRKHSTAAAARKLLGPARWEEFFCFAFVREPLERLRSLHAYAQQLASKRALSREEQQTLARTGQFPNRPPFRFKAVQAALLSDDFDAFVQHPLTWEDPGTAPQWDSVSDERGELLLDFVGRVERIEQDWASVEQRLSVRLALPLANSSGRPREAVPALSAEAKALVRERLAVDYERFGYPAL